MLYAIQEHLTRTEKGGEPLPAQAPVTVLRSFAIPKGHLPMPGEKVLAIPTEDHPLEYARKGAVRRF